MTVNEIKTVDTIRSCDIIRDLMPLASDGVASSDSEDAVSRHIANCVTCRAVWQSLQTDPSPAVPSMDSRTNRKILSHLRRRFNMLGALLILLGASMGVLFVDSELQFHNILLMPLIGGLGHACFKRKALLLPVSVFAMCVVIKPMMYRLSDENRKLFGEAVLSYMAFGVILSVLCVLGIAIAALLQYAFQKKGRDLR